MKKVIFLMLAVCFTVTLAFAADMPAAKSAGPAATEVLSETVVMKGTVIDLMCAGSKTPEELAEFVKTHTKECALMPQCEGSGYAIFSDGKLTKFDSASSLKVAEFLKKADSKLDVTVTVTKSGEELSLVSIENQ